MPTTKNIIAIQFLAVIYRPNTQISVTLQSSFPLFLAIQSVLQLLGGTKTAAGGSLNGNFFPRLWVSSLSGSALSWFKRSKSSHIDPVPFDDDL
jgi:hypothetical protein